ncbi:MAG: leucyl aminopeptidase [Gammaproteobacteria bacterium]|nr:leucyl aminopeptidase [Gammaproteobacteria bacterium]
MEFVAKSDDLTTSKTHCLAVGVFTNRRLSAAAARIDRKTRGLIKRVLHNGDIKGNVGQTLVLQSPPGIAAERILLVGLGGHTEVAAPDFQRAIAAAARTINASASTNVVSALAEVEIAGADLAENIELQVIGFDRGSYRFGEFKAGRGSNASVIRRVTINADKTAVDAVRDAIKVGKAIAGGIRFARDLGNRPANHCTPTYLAECALEMGKQHNSLKVKVLDQAQMEKLGMGALLSVARGSRQPPKLIVMQYHGADAKQAPIALVGKGVTFDSGGISIKPAAAMDEMKFDMCGAASVFGVMQALVELALPINVVGVVPATENLPDGNATKPGDVVQTMSGKTVEILNTDAEGRLILCDALTYCREFNPDVVIDIATLTGACVVALGHHASGLMCADDALANALLAAGNATFDRAWRLPLWDDYQKELDSNFADMANVGSRHGGAITAACFLARFTTDLRWAHLDIAGSAWISGKDKGATGRPVPLLLEYLRQRAAV